MISRRGSSLWGTGLDEMVLQFKPGDLVKPVIVTDHGFVGVVRDVDPRINKVLVAWGNGSIVQHDPDEIMLEVHQDPLVRQRMSSDQGRRVRSMDVFDEGEPDVVFPEEEGPRMAARRGMMGAEKREVVKVNWNDEKSIKDAEKKKSRLENQGYALSQTRGGTTTSELVYVLKASDGGIPHGDSFVGNPEMHGIDEPRGGGFSIMQDLAKDLHKESEKTAANQDGTGPEGKGPRGKGEGPCSACEVAAGNETIGRRGRASFFAAAGEIESSSPVKSRMAMYLKPGTHIKVRDEGGVHRGMTGVVVSPREVKTDGQGIPTNVVGAYKPVNWNWDVVIRLDDNPHGDLVELPKGTVLPITAARTIPLTTSNVKWGLVIRNRLHPNWGTWGVRDGRNGMWEIVGDRGHRMLDEGEFGEWEIEQGDNRVYATERKATGEMGMHDIQPGGEHYEWAQDIERAAKQIQRLSRNLTRFQGMRPFDVYQGPYAQMNNAKMWSSEGRGVYFFELFQGGSYGHRVGPANPDTSIEGSVDEIADWLIEFHKKNASVESYSNLKSRRAMYWCAPERMYRMTRGEQENGTPVCPKCRLDMTKEPFTKSDKLWTCPECGFKVPTSKLTTTRVTIDVDKETGDVDVDVTNAGRRGKMAAIELVGSSKEYDLQTNVGKAKYVVNFHDGVKTHKDGSPFYDIRIFKNRPAAEAFITELSKKGYKEARSGRLAAGVAVVTPEQLAELPKMTLSQIAGLVYDDWRNVNYAAKPYLEAMSTLQHIDDMYMQDTGSSVVAYFLSNAISWRGEVAKAVKKELTRRLR